MSLGGIGILETARLLTDVLMWTSLKVGIALLILAILDYAYQRWKFEQDLRMTEQEVREEMKKPFRAIRKSSRAAAPSSGNWRSIA